MSDPYPNDQLVLVVCEVRYPFLTNGMPRPLWSQLLNHLQHLAPVVHPVNRSVEGADGARIESEVAPQFSNRERTLSITVAQGLAVIETSNYPGWTDFRAVVEATMSAVEAVGVPTAVDRIGLRYIDELRVPDIEQPEWSDYVDKALVPPSPAGLSPTSWQGLGVYPTGEGSRVVLRYGPRDGFAVNTSGNRLKRIHSSEGGPFFLLDTDSFWEAEDESPAFVCPMVLDWADKLHTPIRDVFESLITDKLREEVLNAK